MRNGNQALESCWRLQSYCLPSSRRIPLKEPSLAPYRALAQKLEERFATFEIEHAQRNENRYADAFATLGSQMAFEGQKIDITINKKVKPITEMLKEEFEELSLDEED